MTRTIRVSAEAHDLAKAKAKGAGMKLYEFMQAAIAAFEPRMRLVKSRPRDPAKRAG
jgi:hypothetical protein